MNIKEQKFGDITELTLGETDVGDNVDSELKESIRRGCGAGIRFLNVLLSTPPVQSGKDAECSIPH